MITPEEKIKELGLDLSFPPKPVANYVGAVTVGSLVYLSGQGPGHKLPDGSYQFVTGKVGAEVTVDQAYDAARKTGILLLAQLRNHIGDLNKVRRIVKVLGFVNAVPNFTDHPQVINGASDLFVQVFGEKGKHARSAVGAGSLPVNISVEIEMIVEVDQ